MAAGVPTGYFSNIPAPIYVSADAGATWTLTRAPSNNWSAVGSSADGAKLLAVAAATPHWGAGAFGCGDGLIYTSPDWGVTWTQTSAPSNNWSSVVSSADGAKLVAVSAPQRIWNSQSNVYDYVGDGWIYSSGDSGLTWTRTLAPSNYWTSVASSADGTTLLAAAGGRNDLGMIYTSTNSGATWTATPAPSNNWTSVASSADGARLVAVAALSCPLLDGLIYTSTDSGVTWAPTPAPSSDWTSVASSADGTKLLAAARDECFCMGDCCACVEGLIYTSGDAGLTWMQTDAPSSSWRAIACSADGYRAVAADGYGLICTLPYAGAWRLADAPHQERWDRWSSVASSADGAKLVAVTARYGPICTSSDSGATWTPTGAPSKDWSSVASSADGTKLVAAGPPGYGEVRSIYTSIDSGATWTPTTAPSNRWTCIASSTDGVNLVAGSGPYSGDGLIYISGDSGTTWTPTSAPTNDWACVASSADGLQLVAVATAYPYSGVAGDGLIYTSPDWGRTWTPTTAPSNNWSSVACSADGLKLVAVSTPYFGGSPGCGDGLIYTSQDLGATWLPASAPSNNWVSVSSSADGTKLVAVAAYVYSGFDQSCIYTSTNSGTTWMRADSPAVISLNAVASSAEGSHVVAVGTDCICVLQSPAPAPPVPPSPRLTIDRSGCNLGLSWLVPSTGSVLQQNSDLRSANWVEVPGSPILDCTNMHHRVTLTPSLENRFYRLKQESATSGKAGGLKK